MTCLARVRGYDLQLLVDDWVLPEMKSCLELPRPIKMTWSAGVQDIEPLRITTTRYYPSYYEYNVTPNGVTRYIVYLPEGVKPPEEGSEL